MKMKISEMMDHMDAVPIAVKEKDIVSCQRIKEAAMRKVSASKDATGIGKKRHKGTAAAAIAVIAVIVFGISVTVTVYAGINWQGFLLSDGLSNGEIRHLVDNPYTVGTATEDADGMVHYIDADGKETLVISAAEDAKRREEETKEREQAVADSTDLIDAFTMPVIPWGITPLKTNADGGFEDFLLSNGYMVLLHPAKEEAYELKKGDIVKLSVDSEEEAYLIFSVFSDGKFVQDEMHNQQHHMFTYEIPENGKYNFSLTYGSVSADSFTKGKITITR